MSQDGVHGSRVFQRSELARPLRDQLITARPIWHEWLLTVINDILDFSRIEAGRLTIAPFDCNLLQGLSDVLKPLILRAEAKHLRMRFTASSDVPELVCVDLDRVRQFIVNLCGNAIKFTHTGSVELELSVTSETGSHLTLAFSVRDTGIGIEPEKLASVFEVFTQADTSITRLYGGTGLGLAICTRLVRLMEGKIWAESKPNEGSCFHFTLPCKLAAPRMETPVQPPVAIEMRAVRPLRVLLVEDNGINRKLASKILEVQGHVVVCAHDGQEAVEMLALDRTFDVVLMDLQMPRMGGLEATRIIRDAEAFQDLPRLPIIALTAHAMKGDDEICFTAGMDDYLSKPIAKAELSSKLQKWTSHPVALAQLTT